MEIWILHTNNLQHINVLWYYLKLLTKVKYIFKNQIRTNNPETK